MNMNTKKQTSYQQSTLINPLQKGKQRKKERKK